MFNMRHSRIGMTLTELVWRQ